jgi:hypothetical protein
VEAVIRKLILNLAKKIDVLHFLPRIPIPGIGGGVHVDQGDQIWRIFAHWATVFFGQLF